MKRKKGHREPFKAKPQALADRALAYDGIVCPWHQNTTMADLKTLLCLFGPSINLAELLVLPM